MLKRVLSFIGWVITIFFLVGAFAEISEGEVLSGIGDLVWGVIFLPPLCRVTGKYGLTNNIAARVVLFVLVPILFPPPPKKAATQPVSQVIFTKTVQASNPKVDIPGRQAPKIT
jgi:hypothetical protein